MSKDTTDGVALNLSATVEVANVEAGIYSSADANKLVTAIDAEEIANNVINVSINGTDSTTIGGKIKEIKETVDDIENALSGVAQVVNDLELSTTQAISDAISEAKTYTNSEIDKIEQSISDALATHTQDIAKVEAAIEGLTTTGLTRHVLPDGQTTDNITDPQANVIYLVKDSTSETGDYVEYLYVNGKFEAIGTTSTDLSEYVKSVKINSSEYSANTTNKGALDLGTVVTGLYNSLPSGVTVVNDTLVNANSVYAGIADGIMEIGVADASTNGKGLVKLAANVANASTTDVTTAKVVKDYADTKVGDVQWFKEADLISTTAAVKDGKLIVSEQELAWEKTSVNDPWNSSVTKVINNEAFNAEGAKIASVETSKLKDGSYMFYSTQLTEFSSDLSSLTDGNYMFNMSDIKEFVGDLSLLTDGSNMFSSCPQLTTFIGDLSSLTDGYYMFASSSQLTTFIGDLSSLTDGYYMFYCCNKLSAIETDLGALTNGSHMFYMSSLSEFDSDLGALTKGDWMFADTNLSLESIKNIADSINTQENDDYLTIMWKNLDNDSISGTHLDGNEDAFVTELCKIVDKGWRLQTNNYLNSKFEELGYTVGSGQVMPPQASTYSLRQGEEGEEIQPIEITYIYKK